jgi:hypothetical protein
MLYGITLIILGLMASPSILLNKKPEAKELLDKLVPYQGWIGLVFAFYGAWITIHAILNINLLSVNFIWWLTWFSAGVVQASLGFLLGYGMLQKLIFSKNEVAKEKAEELLKKLAPMQGKFGLFGVILGVWVILVYLIWV